MPHLVPFSEFVDRTRSARFEEYAADLQASAKRQGLRIDAEAEFRRMKDYLLDYYEGVHPVCSMLGADGHPVDCVPFEEQPGARLAARAGHTFQTTPPVAAMPETAQVDTNSARRTTQGAPPPTAPSKSPPPPTLANQRREPGCPEGTVPLRRITLEDLVRNGSLDHYLRGMHTLR